MRVPVRSRQPQSTDVSLRVQTALTRACAVLCAHFLASFLRFRCLNVTALFNIDVKNTFSCHRYSLPTALLLFCAFAVAYLSACNTCSRYFSLHFLMLLYSLGALLQNCAILTPSSRLCVALMFPHPLLLRKCRCLFS